MKFVSIFIKLKCYKREECVCIVFKCITSLTVAQELSQLYFKIATRLQGHELQHSQKIFYHCAVCLLYSWLLLLSRCMWHVAYYLLDINCFFPHQKNRRSLVESTFCFFSTLPVPGTLNQTYMKVLGEFICEFLCRYNRWKHSFDRLSIQ